MKRGLLILFVMLSCGFNAVGRNTQTSCPDWTFGAEWTYNATFHEGYHHYFISTDGSREEMIGDLFTYYSNGEISIHGGYNFNNNWNLSLYISHTRLGGFHNAIPVTLRATRYFGQDTTSDRWFAFADLGSGFSLKQKPQEIYSGKLGGGYRLTLSRYTKLDFHVALRTVYTHPDVLYYGEQIDKDCINRNDGHLSSLSFGIGLTF
jgi:hypothetical protein